jgi:integrase/recombinase XerD
MLLSKEIVINESASQVWLRLTAFLSTRSPNTQIAYRGIIKEWCNFIGSEIGSQAGAKRLLDANDLDASYFRKKVLEQPGIKARYNNSSVTNISSKDILVNEHSISTLKNIGSQQKKTGLEDSAANATVAKKLSALRRIYKVFVGSGLISQNPFDSDKVPSPSANSGMKRQTEMIDFKLVKEIINIPDVSNEKGRRDRAILAVLFGGGLRRGEVIKLTLCDVRTTPKGTLYLHLRATKSKRDADQPLPDWASQIVRKLLSERRAQGAKDRDPLFIGYEGQAGKKPTNKKISESGLYLLFKKYCKLAGSSDYITPHSARATAITKLLEQGLSHREVKEFSRHSSIQMVEVYDKRRIGIDENAAKELDYD